MARNMIAAYMTSKVFAIQRVSLPEYYTTQHLVIKGYFLPHPYLNLRKNFSIYVYDRCAKIMVKANIAIDCVYRTSRFPLSNPAALKTYFNPTIANIWYTYRPYEIRPRYRVVF